MATTVGKLVKAILISGLVGGAGLGQQGPHPPFVPYEPFEFTAKRIRMVQPTEFIRSSALCEQARQSQSGYVTHHREVDPATLEPDLRSLMERSDEVVLAGFPFDEMDAISPSRNDVADFYDVKVLRTWKGSHKVGDTLTFAFPEANIRCGPGVSGSKMTSFRTLTAMGSGGFQGTGFGPYVLFLRRSQGEEKRFMPGFQLTGGSGMQGMFKIPLPVPFQRIEEKNCNGVLDGAVEMCRTYLESSSIPIRIPYGRDPLFKQYNGMPIYAFLNEVQSVADSLGYAAPADNTK